MGDVKLDPVLCRELAAIASEDGRLPVRLVNRLPAIAGQLTAAADMAAECDLIALQFDAAGIDRTLSLAQQAQVLQERLHASAVDLADSVAKQLSAEARAVIELANAWLDDPCKGLGSHREHDLATAVRVLRRARAAGIAPAFDRAAVAITGQPAAELTARLNDNLKAHPDRAFDDSGVQRVDITFDDDDQVTSPAPRETMADAQESGERVRVARKDEP